jgi:hypothetical protein
MPYLPGPTVAHIWVMFAQAALARSADTSPRDAASLADALTAEFEKRFTPADEDDTPQHPVWIWIGDDK